MIDILIYAIGYELRAGFIADNVSATKRLGIVFSEHHVHSFGTNLSKAHTRSDKLIDEKEVESGIDQDIRNAVFDLRKTARPDGRRPCIGIDVSSMTRGMMGSVLMNALAIMAQESIAVTLLYAPQQYQMPPAESEPFVDFRAVPGFEGWTSFPERPLGLILGVGYEVDHAIGSFEYLDPSGGVWAFIPKGDDARFDRDTMNANRTLWPIVEPARRVEYHIANPYRLYADFRTLVEVLSQRSRVICVPGGPKIFSAISMLIKLEVGEEMSVWRASAHDYVRPREALPSGSIVKFEYPRLRVVHSADTETSLS